MKKRIPKYIHEILEMASDIPRVPERIKFLHQHNCLALRDVLNGGFNDAITWDLPEGTPPYNSHQSDEGLYPNDLKRESRTLAYLVKHPMNAKIPTIKKETMFIRLLESIHPKDAELLIMMKDKTIHKHYKGISRNVVEKAFPELNI